MYDLNTFGQHVSVFFEKISEGSWYFHVISFRLRTLAHSGINS
jgi:hypothetical protein